TGSTSEILQRPQHPYTTKLLAAPPSSQPGAFALISDKADVVLEASGIGKAYGQNENSIQAVRRVDLRVRRGEIVGIYGPSGCGKSTLLRILATIETPTEGSIFLGGELATSARTDRLLSYNARNGFVMPIFQDPVSSLDRRWPIWRTVTEALTAKHPPEKPSREHRQSISLEFLRRVGLDAIAPEVRPGELSVGQCLRVAIARALVAEPKLIVADEPTSALDAVIAASVLRLLKQAADSGMGIVIVSHDRTLLDALCNRVWRCATE
ncbi:MAG: ATP-binding cassette domain-containing protein, partial [Blastocatellia bacterium]